MDLTNAIVGYKQAQVASQVQYAVAKKILDTTRSQGAVAIGLIQAATDSGEKGADSLAVAASGLGAALDVQG